jgi:hemerythrin superfamily protein
MGIESTARKAGRKVGKLISAVSETGEIDILDKLRRDHNEVEDLLTKLVDSQNGAERKSLLSKIGKALIPHVRAEEKAVYKAVIALKGKAHEEDGRKGYLEHSLADKMLSTLGKITNAASPEFSAAAKVLKDLVLNHVEEEERNIWPDVRDNFSAEERLGMAREFEAAKKKVRVP